MLTYSSVSSTIPFHRTIVALDIARSTTRTNPARARLRHDMYDLIEQALQVSGITRQHRDVPVDRGDGALILIHPSDQVPKTLLLSGLIPTLGRLLAHHNMLHPDFSFELRTAIQAGEVHYDRRGPFGEAVDLACRLLDAPALKATLPHTSPLTLAVSDYIYQSIIKHRYENVDALAFQALIHLELAGHKHHGWVQQFFNGSIPTREPVECA
jgi:hypothetical protein